jgi:hypothetical protein
LLSYMSLRLSQKSSRLSAALRVPRGRCGRQRRLSDRRCVANPAIISVRDCCSTVWKSVGGEVVGAGLASDGILLVKKSAANRRPPRCESRSSRISRTRESGAAPPKSGAGENGRAAFGR